MVAAPMSTAEADLTWLLVNLIILLIIMIILISMMMIMTTMITMLILIGKSFECEESGDRRKDQDGKRLGHRKSAPPSLLRKQGHLAIFFSAAHDAPTYILRAQRKLRNRCLTPDSRR